MTLEEVGNNALTRWLVYTVLTCIGVALLTLSAQVKVPMWPVSASLQTLAVFGLATLYGFRLGMVTMFGYMLLGALGFDVFAGTTAELNGWEYMQGTTGGYLLGFVIAMGLIAKFATSVKSHLWLMFAGTAVIYALGVTWLAYQSTVLDFNGALWHGMIVFLLGDALKLAIVAGLGFVLQDKIQSFKEKLHLK